jgi:hypothetical protein
VADVSSEQIAEEDRRNVESGLMPASTTEHGTATAAVERVASIDDSPAGESSAAESLSSGELGESATPEEAATVSAPSAMRRILSRWQQFPGPARRLVLWAGVVLIVGFLLRAGDAVQPAFVSPQERFEKFAENVEQRLPAILYGTDPFGQPLLPVEVKWEILPSSKTGGPLRAELTFDDASFSNIGQVLYTHYKIDYQWQRDHWECHNLKCDVERPELTKLDQMDFNAVLAHESAEKNLELVKLKRAQAEALLRPTLPLGELLRSANLY